MADFENNNMNTSNAQNGAQGGAAGNDPYAYQNGYYRNTTPHQDEAVHSGAGTARNTAASGAAPQKENNGYTYVNYYSDPNGRKPGDPDKKPKKKHTGLKVAAFVLSMVLVSGASIGVYEGVRSYNSENGTSIVAEQSSSADSKGSSKKSDSTASDNQSGSSSDSSESWIQLASTNGSMSVADIVKKVTPSVVGVQSTFATSNGNNQNYYGNFFGYGGSGSGQDNSQQATGVGTGIVMSKDGYIVTNAHVIYDDEYG